MKVWIGYECRYYPYDPPERDVVKVFDCEDRARLWKEDPEFKETEYEWREYREHEVE
jgi:hypothetical protein